MLIQRTPSCSMTSTLGSAGAGATGALARGERRRRGRGRLGIASEGVVLHRRGHLYDSTSTAGWADLRPFSRGPDRRKGTPAFTARAFRGRHTETGGHAGRDCAHTPRAARARRDGRGRVPRGAGAGGRAAR